MNDAVTPVYGSTKWLLVISAVVGSSVFEFAWTIAGVALPHMQGAFSATSDQIAWVMTAFVLGAAVVIPCIGWLSDRFGRKRVFALSIAGFTLTLVACASTTTLFEQSFWRFMQGALGAAIIPLGQAITVDAFPSDQQGKATAIWGSGVVLGGIMGPVIGGIVVEYLSWPWIYWLNVPVGLIALLGVIFFIPEIENEPDRPMDWFGFFLITSGLATFQIMLNRGERLLWFDSPEIILECIYSSVALYLFIAHSWTAKNPFFRPQLFLNRNFVVGQFFTLVNGAVAILPLVLLPLLLQNVGGYPAITAGGLIVFRGLGLILGLALVSQFTDRVDARYTLAAALMITGVSGWAMSIWTVEISAIDVMWTNLLQGMGSGIMYVQITALTFATLPSRLRTEGFAVFHTLLFLGAAMGVAAIVFVHTRTFQTSHAVLTEFVTPFREIFSFAFVPESWDIDTISGLASLQSELARQATMIAYNNTFFAVSMMCFSVIPLVWMFNRHVGTESGKQYRER